MTGVQTCALPILLDRLREFNYRGNIRQLENMIQYALIIAGRKPLAPVHFPALKKASPAAGARSLAEAEKETIEIGRASCRERV